MVIESSLYENFTLRGASYKAGMLLLIKYLTKQEWRLGNQFSARVDLIGKQVEKLYKDYVADFKGEKTSSFEAANKHLNSRLLAAYTSLLDSHTTLDNSFQSLLDAERCAVWIKGRRSFETQVTFPARGNDNNPENLEILLSEKPLADKELVFREYIDNDARWFRSLAAWQKNFVTDNQKELALCSIPSSLRSVPGLANLLYHECKINNSVALSYFRHATQLPIGLLENKNTDDEQFRLTCLNLASQIRLSIAKQSDLFESLSELVILSQSILSPGKMAKAKAQFISRVSDNDTQIYVLKEKAIKLFQFALANPEISIDDRKIKMLFFSESEQNQNLLYKDFLKKWGLLLQNNKVYQYKHYKPTKLTLLSTNNPFNLLRHFGTYSLQNQNNELNTALLLGAVARYLKPLFLPKPKINQQEGGVESWPQWLAYINQCGQSESFNARLSKLIKELSFCEKVRKISANSRAFLLKTLEDFFNGEIKEILDEKIFKLLRALQTLLSIPAGQGVFACDERHKPQLRCLAQMVIVNCLGGVSWVACKSGKDRTGGASIAMDAAEIYYQQNKKFPHYQSDKSDREHYLMLLKALFKSGHHQRVASHNAPGANGLIKPDWFFPSDIRLDRKGIQLETQLAHLNKPKEVKNFRKEFFNTRALDEDLQDIKDRTINLTLGSNITQQDWERNWETYSINGRSVKELRKGKRFENEKDLSEFIESHLLEKIEDKALKRYYKALVLYSFHHGGFPHAFSKVNMELINECYQQHHQSAIIGQPEIQINFSWSEKDKLVYIEEISCYKEKKDFKTGEVLYPEKGDYYCRSHFCLSLCLSEVKDKGYQLAVSLQSAHVDCAEERLKPAFFLKKPSLLAAFIDFLRSLLVAIKRYFGCLVKPNAVLNEDWMSGANRVFFKKTTVTAEKEQQEMLAHQRSLASSVGFF